MLNEQHGPAPQEDEVLLLALGALALARRIREWIEREAPGESAREERPSAVSADGAQVSRRRSGTTRAVGPPGSAPMSLHPQRDPLP
jgi:hypothetical protein